MRLSRSPPSSPRPAVARLRGRAGALSSHSELGEEVKVPRTRVVARPDPPKLARVRAQRVWRALGVVVASAVSLGVRAAAQAESGSITGVREVGGGQLEATTQQQPLMLAKRA